MQKLVIPGESCRKGQLILLYFFLSILPILFYPTPLPPSFLFSPFIHVPFPLLLPSSPGLSFLNLSIILIIFPSSPAFMYCYLLAFPFISFLLHFPSHLIASFSSCSTLALSSTLFLPLILPICSLYSPCLLPVFPLFLFLVSPIIQLSISVVSFSRSNQPALIEHHFHRSAIQSVATVSLYMQG